MRNPIRPTFDNVLVQRHAALAIGNIAQNERNRVAIGGAGGVELLMSLGESTDIQVQANAMWALSNVAWSSANQEKIGRLMDQLLDLCDSEVVEVAEHASTVLANALFYHEANRIRIGELDGALEQIAALCSHESARVREGAVRALGTAAHNDQNSIDMCDGSAAKVIIELGKGSDDPMICRYAAFALLNLSVHDANKPTLVRLGAVTQRQQRARWQAPPA